jgi:hypothetical protein
MPGDTRPHLVVVVVVVVVVAMTHMEGVRLRPRDPKTLLAGVPGTGEDTIRRLPASPNRGAAVDRSG